MWNIKFKFLWCFVLTGVCGDTILEQIQSRPELYSKMKKVWHIFVKTFLRDKVLYKITSLTDFKKSLLQILKLSERFVKLIDRDVDITINRNPPVKIEQTVKWSFGKINFNFNSPFRGDVLFNLTFDMNNQYQLNLTINEIYFSSNSCYLGMLSISQALYKGYYKFCGYHSQFNFYPQDRLLYIKSFLREGESISLNIGFTIFDRNIVSSAATAKNFYFDSIQPAILHKLEDSVTLQFLAIYFIQTKVTSRIKLKFMLQVNVQPLLHDGPSVSFYAVRVTRSFYKTSTHQCALQILWRQHLPSTKNQTTSFSYTSLALNGSFVQLHEYYQNDSISLPMEVCQQSHCLMRIQSQQNNFQVNITITKITSDITHNPKCIYGGLVIGEQMYNNQQDYQTLCENHDGSKRLSKSVYSSNSSLFIALYWYNSIGQITTSLSISQTPCKPLYIDDCRIVTFYGNEKNQSRCLSYLNSITTFTDVCFKKCYYEWRDKHALYLSSTKKTSCTIIQFIRKYLVSNSGLLQWPNICRTRLIIDLFSDIFMTAGYEFKISFGPLPYSWQNAGGHDEMGFENAQPPIGIHNESIVVKYSYMERSPHTLNFVCSIHRQRHSWIEMKLNISASSCVLQSTNTGSLLFYSLNNTRTETKCPEQTVIMRIPELRQHKEILLEIDIMAYQGLVLENPKKERMYWLYYRNQYKWLGKEIIQLKFLKWVSKIKPSEYTMISLPGKMYQFKIKIMNKS